MGQGRAHRTMAAGNAETPGSLGAAAGLDLSPVYVSFPAGPDMEDVRVSVR